MIETTGLTRRYGNVLAVDHLDLSVAEGERCAFCRGRCCRSSIFPRGCGR